MNADEVARYLSENPDFFEQYSDLLSRITIAHPHGGRAISLSDRQLLALRNKNKAIEAKLAELIQFGEENDAIGEKMHRLSLGLLPTQSFEAMLAVLYYNLRRDFSVPYAALRIWGESEPGAAGTLAEFRPVGEDIRSYAAGLEQPYCGPSRNVEAASWFGEGAGHARSVALMPLGRLRATSAASGDRVGMLALGSADVLRFYPEMGTVFLRRLGELVSAALARYL